ncbi:MAG: molybdopterin guanine dinucleotide biosynthesis accessory protein MobB, partial [Deltaproteobacteria bacterium]|nr:molybdopterin guanine dinucleotide biosynthesis accessory protein MobB [Deltaproteobacteria bacterium]
MGKRKVPVISFVGRSNTGKTTLLEKVIPLLRSRGLRVGTVKHHAGEFEIDREGKDSYRHKKAGATATMITSPTKVALVEDISRELTLSEVIERYMHEVDLVITEGYKRERMPKVELYVHGRGAPPLATEDPDIIAIATDGPAIAADAPVDELIDVHVPVFSRDEPEPIVDLIVKRLKLGSRVKRAGSRVTG